MLLRVGDPVFAGRGLVWRLELGRREGLPPRGASIFVYAAGRACVCRGAACSDTQQGGMTRVTLGSFLLSRANHRVPARSPVEGVGDSIRPDDSEELS